MKRISCLIVLCMLALQASAQRTSAILVKLSFEKNRIDYLNSKGQRDKAKEISDDAEIVRSVTINDFTDNFKYAPVYYFADTNLDLIKEKKFDRILFDNKYRVFESSPVGADDSTILITYYGVPPIELKDKGGNSEEKYEYRDPGYNGKGLVVLGHDYKRRKKSNRLYYVYRHENWLARGGRTKYSYISKDNSLSYISIAATLQKRLE